jgi:trimethylamine--corrinoid protein Co-methyltransferase
MDADFAAMIAAALEGLTVSDQTLAWDAIEAGAHQGGYHAGRAVRGRHGDLADPRLIDRRPREPWLADGGGLDMYQRARARLKEIVDGGPVEPLDGETLAAVSAIAREAR